MSYAELTERTADLASRWAGLGVSRGDRVVLVLPDEREFVLTILSAMRAGVVTAPVFPPVILSQLDDYLATLRRMCAAAGAAVCVTSELVASVLRTAELPCRVVTVEELAAATPGGTGEPTPGDPAFLQFTSGSTGEPKGVVVPNRTLIAHAAALAETLAVVPGEDRGVSWLPLYHDMGLIGKLFVPLVTELDICYASPLSFVRDPLGFLRLLTDVAGTISFAPNFGYGLLAKRAEGADLSGIDLSTWRVAGCGAEPVSAATLHRFATAFAGVGFRAEALLPCYGLAEATLAVSSAPVGTGMRELTVDAEALSVEGRAVPVTDATASATADVTELVSSGRPLPATEIRVVDENGQPVDDDTVGEVVVRGETLAAGYFEDPELTARTWREGWLHTGDTGFRHAGELYVTGRIKDVIIVNGRNYQPHEIEHVAEQVEGVRPSNAVALPTPRGDSEAVRLVLEARHDPPEPDLADRVRRAVQQRLAVPIAEVVVVGKNVLPKTSSGKRRRRHTAQLLDAGELGGTRR